ncbi:single-stranded DNA-binding protein [Paenibacillus sp. y28]|uniref:single-stranded DNA-binding protein n=1 Tax=Paenibacillus sp. y28 TaxID=3129110 RepID=UPI00301A1705
MLNRVILIGRLTRDPELRYTPAGVAVTQFSLAVNRSYSNQQGDREADFIDIVTWRQLAETCANYLRKGRLTAVEGRIQTRNYENAEGRKVYVTEVVADNVRFLESSGSGGGGGSSMPEEGGYGGGRSNYQSGGSGGGNAGGSRYNGGNNRGGGNQDPFSDDGKPIDISDDDLPF